MRYLFLRIWPQFAKINPAKFFRNNHSQKFISQFFSKTGICQIFSNFSSLSFTLRNKQKLNLNIWFVISKQYLLKLFIWRIKNRNKKSPFLSFAKISIAIFFWWPWFAKISIAKYNFFWPSFAKISIAKIYPAKINTNKVRFFPLINITITFILRELLFIYRPQS